MMNKTYLSLAGLYVCALVATANAVPMGYGVAVDQNLYLIDLGGGTATLIGSTGHTFEGVALSDGGVLYGTDLFGRLFEISTTDASTTLIGDPGLGNMEGLDFNNGMLLASDFLTFPSIYQLSLTDATPTQVFTSTVQTGVIRSMATQSDNVMLVRVDGVGNQSENFLNAVNIDTDTVTPIGDLGDYWTAGMDFADDGNLYGLSDEGVITMIDPATGSSTVVGDTGDQFWLDFTAIPEPTTLVILLAGAGCLAIRRR